jgi:hypothetical protein
MIYISGSITKNKNWEKDFLNAEKYLVEKKGYRKVDIVNPIDISKEIESKMTIKPGYNDYMRWDINILMKCNSIYLLRGWWRSKGARLERHLAKVFRMKIIYQRSK